MEEKQKCPICEGEDLQELVRGYLGNPVLFFKCKKCYKEFKKEK